MKPIRISALALALTLAGVQSSATAATATTTLPVTATVLATCVVVATPLIFGNYSGAQLDAQAALTVTCTLGTTYNVRLDAGAGTGATVATRKLSFGVNTLNYTIWRDAAHTQNWGITDGTDTVAGTGAVLPNIHNVYGRIPAGQFSAPGAYLDTVGVTVFY